MKPLRAAWARARTVPMLRATIVWFVLALVAAFVVLPIEYVSFLASAGIVFGIPLSAAVMSLAGLIAAMDPRPVPRRKRLVTFFANQLTIILFFVVMFPLARAGEWVAAAAYAETQRSAYMAEIARIRADLPAALAEEQERAQSNRVTHPIRLAVDANGVLRVAFALPWVDSDSIDMIVWDETGAVAGGAPIAHWRGGYEAAPNLGGYFGDRIRWCRPLPRRFYLCKLNI